MFSVGADEEDTNMPRATAVQRGGANNAGDNGNAILQSYLPKIFKKYFGRRYARTAAMGTSWLFFFFRVVVLLPGRLSVGGVS